MRRNTASANPKHKKIGKKDRNPKPRPLPAEDPEDFDVQEELDERLP